MMRYLLTEGTNRCHNTHAVRQKAKDVRALLQDDERLRDERIKAKRNRGKFTGVSASDMRLSLIHI